MQDLIDLKAYAQVETKNAGNFYQLVVVVLAMEEGLLSEHLQRVLGEAMAKTACFEGAY